MHIRTSRLRGSSTRFRAVGASGLAVVSLALAGLVAPTVANAGEPSFETDPAKYIDPFIGTGRSATAVSVAEINNNPGPSTPFGMVQNSPDTQDSYSGYMYTNNKLTGFSLTHVAAGCTAMGDVPFLPSTKLPSSESTPDRIIEKYSHDDEDAEAGYYRVKLQDSNIEAQLTATNRVAVNKYDYPGDGKTAYLYMNLGSSKTTNYSTQITIDPANKRVTGSTQTGNFCGKGNKYTVYFAAEFSKPFSGFGTYKGSSKYPNQTTITGGDSSGGWLEFPSGSKVETRVAISFVSTANALENLNSEAPWTKSFDTVRADSRSHWNDALDKAKVAGKNQADLRLFYTTLYHSLIHPSTFSDVNGQYRGYDNVVYQLQNGQEAQYANYSDWDTYRALAPLQGMLFPKQASDMAQSLVNAGDQMGSLPRWPVMNSATGQMTGDNVTPLIANLQKFGAKDFDQAKALQYMVKSANDGGPANAQSTKTNYSQRPGATIYNEKGYAPQVEAFRGDHAIVGASVTLEYSIDDFAISRLASDLGQTAVADDFKVRAQRWQNLFDPSTKRITPRASTGEFIYTNNAGFGEDGFDEGNAEQYSWMIPHNTATLVSFMGGKSAAEARLDEFAKTTNSGSKDPHLWAGNEPTFGVAWIYNYLGAPAKTQALVRRVMNENWSATPQGEPGNDDLGGLSAWYVWAAMGMYPITSGTSNLALNTPIFDKVELTTANGKKITIDAPGASRAEDGAPAKYIQSMTLDGKAWNKTYLPEDVAINGGSIKYTLVDTPAQAAGWGTAPDSVPPSYTDGGKQALVNVGGDNVSVRPGTMTSADVSISLAPGEDRNYTVALAEGADSHGLILTPPSGTTEEGVANAKLGIRAPADLAEGIYPLSIVVSIEGLDPTTIPVVVKVAKENSLFGTYQFVAQAPAGSPTGTANFDGSGNGYMIEELEKLGVTPGAVLGLPNQIEPDVKFTWPNVPQGVPNLMMPQGQTIAVPAGTTKFSLVGAGIETGGNGPFVINYNDGTSKTVTLGLGDWVLPKSDDQSLKWPKMAERVAVSADHGAYLMATPVQYAPTGKSIKSITFADLGAVPKTNKMRIVAIAVNSAQSATNIVPVAVLREASDTNIVQIPEVPHVVYTDAEGNTLTGFVNVPVDGTLIVKAVPESGYTLEGGTDTQWEFKYLRDPYVAHSAVQSATSNFPNSGGESVDKIRDRNSSTKWYAAGSTPVVISGSSPVWVIYSLSTPAKLTGYEIVSANDEPARDPQDWKVLGSNDPAAATDATHASWTVVDTQTNQSFSDRFQQRIFDTIAGPYKYYQLSVTKTRGLQDDNKPRVQIADWTLRGTLENVEVTPGVPVQDGNVVTVPATVGVVYQNDGGDVVSGNVVVSEGGLTIKAVPADGFVFPEGATTEWSFDYVVPPVEPTEPVVVRHGGATRYDTSFEVAREVLVAGKPLFVATGLNFPDALAGGAAAAHVDGALILVGSRVPDATLALLGEKKPSEVYVLGGSGAVSELVVSQLQTATGVTPVRLSGKNRFETASKVASTFFAGATCAYVASGDNFPDALAASGKAGRDGCPIILFGRGTADLPATANSVFIVGGKGVIPEAYKDKLDHAGMSVTRLAGVDRYATSQQLMSEDAAEVWVANGFSFPDALSAAAPSGKAGATMVLAKTNCIPLGAKPAIGANTIKVHLVGGNGALNQNVAALKYCDN